MALLYEDKKMKIKTSIKLIATIFLVSFLSGCASVSAQKGFDDVQSMVQSRTGLRTHWDQGTSEDEWVQETVKVILDDKL